MASWNAILKDKTFLKQHNQFMRSSTTCNMFKRKHYFSKYDPEIWPHNLVKWIKSQTEWQQLRQLTFLPTSVWCHHRLWILNIQFSWPNQQHVVGNKRRMSCRQQARYKHDGGINITRDNAEQYGIFLNLLWQIKEPIKQ